MAHNETAHTAAHTEEHGFDKKAIMRTFWILLVITCVELIIGMFIAPHFPSLKLMFNVLYIIFTLAKAFYIIAEFMHLRHELKNMIMTVAMPCLLFIWFIIAFLWDGNSYKNLRNTYDPYHKQYTTEPAKQAPAAHGHEEAEKPGAVH
ncbi:MAG: cytochrome C oxidase subunit IV family protein [Candidatus Pseudobacter hemicellulosilyticus]|uniref:Cytochrome C oxidase subunit IV family protein n=1 Tax=Candidatus Pseudobacter hemicellulosilyticus TaxID=3121375 RepID=A0AAJ5WU26_9BACT|nr:MAG: cytochrome C oxidase subunit IV family protein [Pseudobacter sp.]